MDNNALKTAHFHFTEFKFEVFDVFSQRHAKLTREMRLYHIRYNLVIASCRLHFLAYFVIKTEIQHELFGKFSDVQSR